jgi:hypothetical protein
MRAKRNLSNREGQPTMYDMLQKYAAGGKIYADGGVDGDPEKETEKEKAYRLIKGLQERNRAVEAQGGVGHAGGGGTSTDVMVSGREALESLLQERPQKPDPRLEVLLERLMDAAPSSSDPPEAVAYPPLVPSYNEEGTFRPINKPSDSLFEDIIEVIDPTGISSWDDASRAYDSYTERIKNTNKYSPTMDEFIDVLGAVPMIGKIPKAAKIIRGASKYITPAVKAVKKVAKSPLSSLGFILDRLE